jgi:hyperosmotically inducible periplasmic protein
MGLRSQRWYWAAADDPDHFVSVGQDLVPSITSPFITATNPLEKETIMKALQNAKLIAVSMLIAIGLAACDKPGPAESAGKKIDNTADAAGKKISETVDKVGAKISTQSEKTGIAFDDVEITTKVKAAIFAEPGLKTLQISVDTVKGVVTLSGSVDSQANSDRAKALASAVAGVTSVENRLMTK